MPRHWASSTPDGVGTGKTATWPALNRGGLSLTLAPASQVTRCRIAVSPKPPSRSG
jgi:hypothetical protein